MRLADMSTRLRRERVIFALDVALQDITAPASTMDIARMIAARLECTADELPLIGRIIVGLAPALPQAKQASETFKRYGRLMRPWVWSPKRAVVASVDPVDPDAAYEAHCRAAGLDPETGRKLATAPYVWTE